MASIEKFIWRNTPQSEYHAKTSESGLHSDIYLNSDFITSNPTLLAELIQTKFVQELKLRNIHPDWVITYPPYGMVIGYELARQIWAKFAYINKEEMSCSFAIAAWETAVIVADDIYTWGSLKDTTTILETMGVIILNPILSIANFWSLDSIAGLDVFSIISEKANLYKEEDCPFCKIWSNAIVPRGNWEKLIQRA